jgi:glycosyltransferase involved in cell wall biosynthesis
MKESIEGQEPISLVFLAYNEIDTIEDEVREFKAKIVNMLPGSEFIIAEDGSTDGTHEVLQRLQQDLGIIHLTSGERKGYRKALLDSIAATKNDLVFFCDTGHKHDATDFWLLYNRRNEADLIVGRKTNREDQWYRKLFTVCYNAFIRCYVGISGVYDCDSGFRLFSRTIAEKIYCSGSLFFKELPASEIVIRTIASGYRYLEVPVAYHMRSGPSRGLPTNKLPKVIIGVIRNLRILKKELRSQLMEIRRQKRRARV